MQLPPPLAGGVRESGLEPCDPQCRTVLGLAGMSRLSRVGGGGMDGGFSVIVASTVSQAHPHRMGHDSRLAVEASMGCGTGDVTAAVVLVDQFTVVAVAEAIPVGAAVGSAVRYGGKRCSPASKGQLVLCRVGTRSHAKPVFLPQHIDVGTSHF